VHRSPIGRLAVREICLRLEAQAPRAAPLDIQREIDAERGLVESNRKLVEIFEKKLQAKLAEIWGEEESAKA